MTPTPRDPALQRAAARYAQARNLAGRTLDERYRLEARVGSGAMADVYLATDLEAGEEVAVKVPRSHLLEHAESVERLRREALIAMRLDHPNVCPILGVGDTEQLPIYLVMPYLTGETLAVREMRRGPLSPGEGIPLLRQLCRGLDHAHGLQILHRDLKPENVILTPDPEAPDGVRAVLLDFGLAKVLREEPGLAPLTRAEMIIGTPDFMSPEQVRGDPLDARSDVYSLGLLAFEMFTGRLPFEGANDEELLIARLKVSPARLRALRPELPEALEQVIDRTLARSPTDRYRTAMELDAALAPLAQ